MPRVVMIGGFPPPIGGASKNNAILAEMLRRRGVSVATLDVSPSRLSHARSARYHLERLVRNSHVAVRALALGTKQNALYVVPSGGYGVWYTWAQLRMAGRLFRRIVIHHRSCKYIEEPSRAMASIAAMFGDRAIHVFLTEGMSRRFQSAYQDVTATVASNARFVREQARSTLPTRMSGITRIGHLSNLSAEKGIAEVATAYARLRAEGATAELWLAGPIVDQTARRVVDSLRREFGASIRYHESLSGCAKNRFYKSLDLFLFPTQFDQEAAPNVVYESLAAGVPVFATDRGCLRDMLRGVRGLVCSRHTDFSQFVSDHAQEWLRRRREPKFAHEVQRSVAAEAVRAEEQHEHLLDLLAT